MLHYCNAGREYGIVAIHDEREGQPMHSELYWAFKGLSAHHREASISTPWPVPIRNHERLAIMYQELARLAKT